MGLESPLSRGPTLAEVLENWGGGAGLPSWWPRRAVGHHGGLQALIAPVETRICLRFELL